MDDLPGIVERLEHLEWLGVDAVWLSPIFSSPMEDFGYDISDYRAVDPLFGRPSDLDALRDALHRRGMRLLLDLVPNHSSDRHPWFRAARSSREDPKRDWYLWAVAATSGSRSRAAAPSPSATSPEAVTTPRKSWRSRCP